jgi:ATP-dependent Lon protease
MAHDNKTKISKKEANKKDKELSKAKKNIESSDDDDNNFFYSDDSENEMDIQEYRKMLKKMFPSKHLDRKIKAGEQLKKTLDKNESLNSSSFEDDPDDSDYVPGESDEFSSEEELKTKAKKRLTKNQQKKQTEKNLKKKSPPKKSKKQIVVSEDESEEVLESDYSNSDDDEDYDKETNNVKGKSSGKFNIIFTIGGRNEELDEEDDDDVHEDWETCSETGTENEDDPISTDDDSTEEDVQEEEEEEEEEEGKVTIKTRSQTNRVKPKIKEIKEIKETKEAKTTELPNDDNILISKLEESLGVKKNDKEDTKCDDTHLIKVLKELQLRNKDNELINQCIRVCEEKTKAIKKKQEKKMKKEKARNNRIFKRLLRDKNTMNDFEFYDKLETDNQKKIIKELREINKISRIEKPYRLTLLESTIPVIFKAAAMKKISSLRYMEPGSGEYYKIKNWVDTFMRIPFSTYNILPLNISDGVEKCHDFMANAQKTLDESVYGLNDAKMQIMQMLGQLITNPKAVGSAIAIHGPPGTGKCHTINTPILMYDGSIKMVQDVKINDLIMGDDSSPRRVINLGRGQDELFEIIPNKGDKFGVNSEHILCLKPSGLNVVKTIVNKNKTKTYKSIYLNKNTFKLESKIFCNIEEANLFLEQKSKENEIVEISVKTLLTLPESIRSKLKCYRTGVEFPNKVVPFDPYIMGIWLGDGTSSKPEITNMDGNILSYIRSSVKKYNLNLNYYSGYSYRIEYNMYDNDSKNNKNIFLETLKDYNLLNNKHIPHDYKINDRYTRLQLLAGILDSDGHYCKKGKGFVIVQKNIILADDILFLAQSLGFAAYKQQGTKGCYHKGEKKQGEYYRINISGNNLSEIPTKCVRKMAENRIMNKDVLVTGFKINSLGIGNYYGFTLDCNHRYLLSDFTVTHNTTLVKEGISKILNRPFAFIALGGATDSSFLEGHGYTYEGSTWGKIVQILIDSKCMNPVIYFDELDKISDTPKGEEIAGILTHLTDTSQNSQFHDKYFAEIDFDLSKCLFIFSYNDENKVNPILKDRMYRIQTKGYSQKQKTVISNNYLLPKIREQVKFGPEDIVIPEQTLQYIIENLCNKEDGVRNLKRCLEIIYTKLNLYRLMRPDSNLFEEDMSLKVTFPFTVTKDIIEKLIKKTNGLNESLYHMYI